MDVSKDAMCQRVTIDSTDVHLPGQPKSVVAFDDVVVVVLGDRTVETEEFVPKRAEGVGERDPDFELPSPKGRLVGIDGDGNLVWSSDSASESDAEGYWACYRFHDRCLCSPVGRDDERGWVEIDPKTGSVLRKYPRDSLEIGGDVRQFQRPINSFLTFDGIGIVKEKTKEDSRLWTGTAFDSTENEIWQREFYGWFLREKDGTLVSKIEHRMGAATVLEHDPETGEPRAIQDTIASEREAIQGWIPSRLHHLIDDYLERIDDGDG